MSVLRCGPISALRLGVANKTRPTLLEKSSQPPPGFAAANTGSWPHHPRINGGVFGGLGQSGSGPRGRYEIDEFVHLRGIHEKGTSILGLISAGQKQIK